MLPVIPYAIGFVIYVLFCLLTVEAYSRNKTITKFPLLIFFYIYYSILAWYTIGIVEPNTIDHILQIFIYMIPCALLLIFYYNKSIKPRDEQLYGQIV